MRDFSDKLCRGNQTKHFMFIKFIAKTRAVCEIIWKNIVEPDRPRTTIWRMRTAYWIPKATNIHSEYVIRIAFPLQQWLRERASMFSYTLPILLIKSTTIKKIICLYPKEEDRKGSRLETLSK
jgi:hypothetical protein